MLFEEESLTTEDIIPLRRELRPRQLGVISTVRGHKDENSNGEVCGVFDDKFGTTVHTRICGG